MCDVWLVGIGNPLRGDDGVGWAVIKALAETAVLPPNVKLLSVHQLLPELLDTIHRAASVIFVDASTTGESGTVTSTPIQPTQQGTASSHQTNPGVLLALGVELYGRMPSATLITISGQSYKYEERLSTAVQAAIPQAIHLIQRIVQKREAVL